ncbi:MAG: hypothetical protein KKF41_07940 [Actinobacteria bacterium]|nr:hypothetical protein [Actinomycetota bacterium]MBU1944182.1 hypothetical protein [Actinomycetota bacterium]MBU2687501.1 hypothetical protein [Actinomycetota bacterium]
MSSRPTAGMRDPKASEMTDARDILEREEQNRCRMAMPGPPGRGGMTM